MASLQELGSVGWPTVESRKRGKNHGDQRLLGFPFEFDWLERSGALF